MPENPSPLAPMAQRIVNAESNFVATVREITGCTPEQARQALRTMRALKVVKLDTGIGRYRATHGAYMERDALRRAMTHPNTPPAPDTNPRQA